MKGKVIIVGGGIVGLSSAYYLKKSGWSVTILDQGDFTDNCSFGNAGMLVPSHFTPLAAPGMISQGVRWMFSSKSPFYVRPSLNGNLLSWGYQFFRHSNSAHVKKAAPFLRDLNLESSLLYKELAYDLGKDIGLESKGILMLVKTEKALTEEAELAHTAQELGLDAQVLNTGQLQALEPQLNLNVLGGVHYKCDGHLSPIALINTLKKYLEVAGVEFIPHQTVTDFEISGGQIREVICNTGQPWPADYFVIATGAWLQQTAKLLGIRVPIMPGKGYSFMTDTFEGKLQHPALLIEDRVAITPMNGRVRVGGTMELAPINQKINKNRVQGIVDAVPRYFSNVQLSVPDEKETWFGFRPCSPDGLPYLSRSKKLSNLVIAGGLGMMGLSLGPAVGHTVANLINHVKVQQNNSIFDAERFN